jgi:hypothetical protein
MIRYILITGLLLVLAGCQTSAASRGQPPARRDDLALNAPEQYRWGRARMAVPDESPLVASPTGIPRPGTWGVPER